MKSLEFLQSHVFFTTKEFSNATEKSMEASSRFLKKRNEEGVICQFTRGIWGQPRHPWFTPYGAIPYLLGNEVGYLSFLSALHRHDVLSQIPVSIQIATSGHGRKLKTDFGTYEFIKIQPKLMQDGVDWAESRLPYRIAIPEKALFDAIYISTRKGTRFARFPEIELQKIKKKKFLQLSKRLIKDKRIRSAVESRFQTLALFV